MMRLAQHTAVIAAHANAGKRQSEGIQTQPCIHCQQPLLPNGGGLCGVRGVGRADGASPGCQSPAHRSATQRQTTVCRKAFFPDKSEPAAEVAEVTEVTYLPAVLQRQVRPARGRESKSSVRVARPPAPPPRLRLFFPRRWILS